MGQSLRQLHGRVSFVVVSFFIILLLWLSIMFFIDGQVLKLILHFFLFITACRGWVIGKCLSNSWRNSWPNFVLRDDEKGGLYQRIFFFFFGFVIIIGMGDIRALVIDGGSRCGTWLCQGYWVSHRWRGLVVLAGCLVCSSVAETL